MYEYKIFGSYNYFNKDYYFEIDSKKEEIVNTWKVSDVDKKIIMMYSKFIYDEDSGVFDLIPGINN
ncbi:MAG: hypothetical protein ACK5LT_07525 [Lachnospirales bacterium]